MRISLYTNINKTAVSSNNWCMKLIFTLFNKPLELVKSLDTWHCGLLSHYPIFLFSSWYQRNRRKSKKCKQESQNEINYLKLNLLLFLSCCKVHTLSITMILYIEGKVNELNVYAKNVVIAKKKKLYEDNNDMFTLENLMKT